MIHPATNRVPGHPISVFNNDIRNLIYSPNFILYLNNYEYSVKEISGIDIDYKYEPNQSGGTEYPIFTHDYGNKDYVRINVKRAMPKKKSDVASKAIQTALSSAAKFFRGRGQNLARKTAMLGASALDPIASLERGPAIGFIQVFSRDFSKVDAAFSFFSLGAEKWTMSPELDASSGDVIYESIDLICQGLTRMTLDWSSPSGRWNVIDSENSMYDESELENLEKLREVSMENIDKIRIRQNENKKGELSIDERIAKLQAEYNQLSKTYDKVVSENREQWDNENRERMGQSKTYDEIVSENREQWDNENRERIGQSKTYDEIVSENREQWDNENRERIGQSKTYDEIVSENEKAKEEQYREVEEERKKQIASFEKEIAKRKKKEEYEKQRYEESLKIAKKESESKGEIYDDKTSEEISRQQKENEKKEREKNAMEEKIKNEVAKEIDRLKRIKQYNDKK